MEKLPTNKVLSVRQPWANLLCTEHGSTGIAEKWCENRIWKPPKHLRPGDRLLIHASAWRYVGEIGGVLTEYVTSAIIGHVRYVGCGCSVDNFGDYCDPTPYNARHDFASTRKLLGESLKASAIKHGLQYVECHDDSIVWWFFDSPVMLAQPIPCKGKLGVWTYTP